MAYYLFAISNHKDFVVLKGTINFKTRNKNTVAVFTPDNKRKGMIYCDKKNGVLYHGSLWYDVPEDEDLEVYKEKAKNIMLDHIDAKINYYNKMIEDNKKLRKAVENG